MFRKSAKRFFDQNMRKETHAVGVVGDVRWREMRDEPVALGVIGIALDLARGRGDRLRDACQTLDRIIGEGLFPREFGQRRKIAANVVSVIEFRDRRAQRSGAVDDVDCSPRRSTLAIDIL